jgi:hypothetical protein
MTSGAVDRRADQPVVAGLVELSDRVGDTPGRLEAVDQHLEEFGEELLVVGAVGQLRPWSRRHHPGRVGSTPRPTAGIAAGVATLLADAAAARLDAAGPGLMAEVFVTRLLGRDEFRRHCDRYRTRDAILANLR